MVCYPMAVGFTNMRQLSARNGYQAIAQGMVKKVRPASAVTLLAAEPKGLPVREPTGF